MNNMNNLPINEIINLLVINKNFVKTEITKNVIEEENILSINISTEYKGQHNFVELIYNVDKNIFTKVYLQINKKIQTFYDLTKEDTIHILEQI